MIRLTREQVREIDRRSIDEYHIPGIVLMENAVSWVAGTTIPVLESRRWHGPVWVVCGGGNNGGDGLGVARYLHHRGYTVKILLATDPASYKGDALIEWRMAQAWGVPVEKAEPESIRTGTVQVIIDAIFGTGLNRAPEGHTAGIIRAMNDRKARYVVAIDIPSGLDCDTGQPYDPCVRASRTVTFVGEKAGFANEVAKEFLGEVIVADIGCPKKLVEEVASRPG